MRLLFAIFGNFILFDPSNNLNNLATSETLNSSNEEAIGTSLSTTAKPKHPIHNSTKPKIPIFEPSPQNTTPYPIFWVFNITSENIIREIKLNMFYAIPENLPTMSVQAYFLIYDIDFTIKTLNLSREIVNMANADAVNYVYKRCDKLYKPYADNINCYPMERDDESYFSYFGYCNSLFHCQQRNTEQIQGIHYFDCKISLMTVKSGRFILLTSCIRIFFVKFINIWLSILCIGFPILNIRLYIKHSDLRSFFITLVVIQSVYVIFWVIFYILLYNFVSFGIFNSKNILLTQYQFSIASSTFLLVPRTLIIDIETFFAFQIEAFRLIKAVQRFLSIVKAFWAQYYLTNRLLVKICLFIFFYSFCALILVVLSNAIRMKYFEQTAGHKNNNQMIDFRQILKLCSVHPYYLDAIQFLYVTESISCIPQYILFDELFPLSIVTLGIDIAVLVYFNHGIKHGKLSKHRKKAEKNFIRFIVLDIIHCSISVFRKVMRTLNYYADPTLSSLFHNIFRVRIFISVWCQLDSMLYFNIKFIFYTFENFYVHLLLRQIQLSCGSFAKHKNDWVDRAMIKVTKKLYGIREQKPLVSLVSPSEPI